MSKYRSPTPEEIAAFHAAIEGVVPLEAPAAVHFEPPKPPPEARQRSLDEAQAVYHSLYGPLDVDDYLLLNESETYLASGLARSVLRDLRRGRFAVQDHIDLHGLDRYEAREALRDFLAHALLGGKRCVRIVHGRGRGSPGREGVLRPLVKAWLSRDAHVLAFCHPPMRDGGEGALWVLLRKA